MKKVCLSRSLTFILSLPFSLSLSLSHILSYPYPLPASFPPLYSSPLPGKNFFYCDKHSAEPLAFQQPQPVTDVRSQARRQPKQPGSPPHQENEQFSHCNNAPLSSPHYRHDKRWNIQGGWPPNLIWAWYWACGKWVLSALIYSLADWPLKLNIITERIFKKPGPQITSKWKY